MENVTEMSTQKLEEILSGHIKGQTSVSGDEILEICEVLAQRKNSGLDAAEIYRRCLCKFLPDDIKKDL